MSTRQEVLEKGDYEPYDNRVRPNQTNRIESLVHLVKGILGTGILALPEAYKNSGFLIGTVGIVVITFLITYCLHLLFDAMYFFCKRDKVSQFTYPDAFKEGLKMGPECMRKCADAAPFVVNFFIILYQIGVCCVYIIFCATNIKQVVDEHSSKNNQFSVEFYMCCFLLPILLICYIKNLKYLAPFSNVANWLTLLGLICIWYFLYEKVEPITERRLFAPIQRLPLYMGTVMFSVLSIGSILCIELNMKDGRYWGGFFGTLNLGMFICTILNIFTGFSGYWKYGEETDSVITLNLDIHHPLAQGLRVLFSAAIYISFALQAYPITEILWEQYIQKFMQTSKHKMVWDYALRTLIVCAGFLPGVTIPHINLFISLFGAFCLSVLGIIFPPFLDMCTRWPDDYGKGNLILVRDILLMLFGFIGWIFGTYTAMRGIVEKLIQS